ncbi:MAG: ABC transporter ATP-binding protein/permease [Acetatifactor sp.]|nr:ABC transporter ATP-binding protein/permease [Acetatifactor sp.]
MAFSDDIISQCDSPDMDGTKDLKTLWRMLRLMRGGFIKYLFAIIAMSLALSGFDTVTALLLKNILARANLSENRFAGLPGELLTCAAAGIALLLVYALAFFVYTMEAKKGGANLQKLLYSKCLRLPYSYYETVHSSDFMSKVIYDCERACGIYGSRFRRILMPFLMTCFYLLVMFWLNPQVTLCLLGVSAALFFINGTFIKPMQRISQDMSATNVSVTERISNILSGIEQIKIFSLKSVMVDRYIRDNNQFCRQQRRMNRMSAVLDGLNQLFDLMGSLVFIALGLFFVGRGITSVDKLAAIYLLYGSMSWNLLQVGLYLPSMASYLANAKRVFAFLETEEEPETRQLTDKRTDAPPGPDSMVCIRGLSFSYNDAPENTFEDAFEDAPADKREVLHDFHLDIPVGKCVAIKGESGKGKSTIAKLLLGLYPIKTGNIYIAGKPMGAYTLQELRNQIGYVPQEPYLYDVSIAENIRYGKPDACAEDIINAAKLANAHEFIMELEDGYETRAGERGNHLSGGQRQRIAIARAILKDAPLLILDEATSALDNQSEQLVNQALDRLMQGRTTIVIAHRQSTLEHADTIVSL